MFPRLRALNFVLRGYLGEGAASSTRTDPQAKALGEFLRARVVDIPTELVERPMSQEPRLMPAFFNVAAGTPNSRHALYDTPLRAEYPATLAMKLASSSAMFDAVCTLDRALFQIDALLEQDRRA